MKHDKWALCKNESDFDCILIVCFFEPHIAKEFFFWEDFYKTSGHFKENCGPYQAKLFQVLLQTGQFFFEVHIAKRLFFSGGFSEKVGPSQPKIVQLFVRLTHLFLEVHMGKRRNSNV